MALTITINISDSEEACLKNDLLDIDDWVQKAVTGKISQCRKRFVREWQPKLFADPAATTMPAKEEAFISAVLVRPDYRDRAARDAEGSAAREAGRGG